MERRNNEINAAVEAFLSNGGKVTELRAPTATELKKAHRKAYLLNTQHDKPNSKAALERAEGGGSKALVFSPVERMIKR